MWLHQKGTWKRGVCFKSKFPVWIHLGQGQFFAMIVSCRCFSDIPAVTVLVTVNFKLRSHTMKSVKALHSLFKSHCTETIQWHCYNNNSGRFSCRDYNVFNDFIVCDRGLKQNRSFKIRKYYAL